MVYIYAVLCVFCLFLCAMLEKTVGYSEESSFRLCMKASVFALLLMAAVLLFLAVVGKIVGVL